jgi:hypothetical protein
MHHLFLDIAFGFNLHTIDKKSNPGKSANFTRDKNAVQRRK